MISLWAATNTKELRCDYARAGAACIGKKRAAHYSTAA